MKFYRKAHNKPIRESAEFPCFAFVRDNWDDYGWKTLYELFYYPDIATQEKIGSVKILHKLDTKSEIEDEFEKLKADFCSLGQSMDYYANLKFLLPHTYIEILSFLNDVAFFADVRSQFEENLGFKKSLLRTSEAEKALIEAKQAIDFGEETIESDFKFTYSTLLDNANAKHIVEIDFTNRIDDSFRSNVIIGRNGTGKTKFLSNLSYALCNLESTKNFAPERPLFSRVIAVSFSMFDKFRTPKDSRLFSYKFIGFRHSEGILDDKAIDLRLRQAFQEIKNQDREKQWFDFINQVIQTEYLGDDIESLLQQEENIDVIINQRDELLSSGQNIIIFVITELIAILRKDSLILFDEPETHLHPNSIARLVKVLNNILVYYNSYAIIATHSPVVIQETPRRNVRLFERIGNTPIIKYLPEESFGENISKITDYIFYRNEVKEIYKEYFDKEIELASISDINAKFDDKLSLNALLYLSAISNNDKE